MTVNNFFKMMENANEFKALIGEAIKTKVIIVTDNITIGSAYTLNEFKKVLTSEFHPEAKKAILNAEVNKTICIKEFKIIYTFDDEKQVLKLFVE